MILGFSTQLNGKPTYFVEKILEGFLKKEIINLDQWYQLIAPQPIIKKPKDKNLVVTGYGYLFDRTQVHIPKLHTFRDDKNNRWKVGTKIDFFINCRQKNMFRFAPVLPVVSTQNILITYTKVKKAMVIIDDKCFYMQDFSLEGNHKMLHLAQNDGFDTIEDFFAYFNEDFKGKIIHWTDLKY